MTEEIKETDVIETDDTETKVDNEEMAEAKYTDEDVNKIVSQKFAKWQKEKDEAIEEAKKLEKMNKEQRDEHVRKQLEQQLEEYKRKDQFYSLSREASNMLSEHSIKADDDLLGMIVKDSAEDTQASVNAFVSLLNQKVEDGVKQALSGNSPRVNAGSNTVSKKQIMEIKNPVERQKAIRDNINLFN